ncbi:related to nitrogen metabolic regulation protein nmr [Phialocephala subalpina]|uniref:Related to nitrogen metabolic regulation protein nmr n=1 Tax=Phialocephala subalpina TaxID=576137 RepID=A0A1L7WP94_9HELO|nr:related to nitrogen metabolic regulation protein nmr [Phialocephala subalpina]
MTKLIVILGITGEQGSSVASHFLTLASYRIRGITRNTSSPTAQAWTQKGISLITADLNSPSTLGPAFFGADIIFATTDFWGPFHSPGTKELLKPGQGLGEYCCELELQQVKNIFDAAAKVEGLERLVVSTLVDVEKASGGKYKGVWHCDGKARGVVWGKEQYKELAGKVDEVFVPNYMSNWLGKIKLRKTEDGAYHLGLVGSGKKPLPHLDVKADLGKIVASTLSSLPGKKVLAAGEMISWSDQMKVWCEVNKVPFGGFDSVPIEVFDRFFPIPGLGTELGEMMAFMEEFGYVGGDPEVVLPGELENPPRLTIWREYAEKQEWESVLNV